MACCGFDRQSLAAGEGGDINAAGMKGQRQAGAEFSNKIFILVGLPTPQLVVQMTDDQFPAAGIAQKMQQRHGVGSARYADEKFLPSRAESANGIDRIQGHPPSISHCIFPAIINYPAAHERRIFAA
jgi:hypothetical protein